MAPEEKDRLGKGLEGEMTYEEALRRLEEIVALLESEEIPIEEAMDGFKEGVRLSRYCREKLAEIEFQVEHLLKEEQETAGESGAKEGGGGDADL